jgi:hypothetical protein
LKNNIVLDFQISKDNNNYSDNGTFNQYDGKQGYSIDIIDINDWILSIISAYCKHIVFPPLASALQWYLLQLLPSERYLYMYEYVYV